MRPDEFERGEAFAGASVTVRFDVGLIGVAPGITPGVYAALNQLVTFIQEAQLLLDLEVEDLVIVLTVLTGNLQRWHRAVSQSGGAGSASLEVELVPMSQSGIARATGMARETVRRRLRGLVARAILSLDGRGSAIVCAEFSRRLLAMPPMRRWYQPVHEDAAK